MDGSIDGEMYDILMYDEWLVRWMHGSQAKGRWTGEGRWSVTFARKYISTEKKARL